MKSKTGRRIFVYRALRTGLALAFVFGAILSGIVRCPTALLFRVPCPMCGSTRAVRALMALDARGAWSANPLGPVVALLVGLFAVHMALVTAHTGSPQGAEDTPAGRAIVRGLVIVLVLQAVVWVCRFAGMFGGPVAV